MKAVLFKGKVLEVVLLRLDLTSKKFDEGTFQGQYVFDTIKKFSNKEWNKIPDEIQFRILQELDDEFHSIKETGDPKAEAGTLAAITRFFHLVGCVTSPSGFATSWYEFGIRRETKNPEPIMKDKPKQKLSDIVKPGFYVAQSTIKINKFIINTGEKVEVVDIEPCAISGVNEVIIRRDEKTFNTFSSFFAKHFYKCN